MITDVYFCFFKQKLAYEISECDGISDVCSSDLYYKAVRADLKTKRFKNQKADKSIFLDKEINELEKIIKKLENESN